MSTTGTAIFTESSPETGDFVLRHYEDGRLSINGWEIRIDAGRHGVAIVFSKQNTDDFLASFETPQYRLFATWDRVESALASTQASSDGDRIDIKGHAIAAVVDFVASRGL